MEKKIMTSNLDLYDVISKMNFASSENMSGLKIGYPTLEENAPFLPGIYLLGALPAMGKTTFALNLAANICESGTPILYVSYEQNEEEFAYKYLARCWYLKNLETNKRTADKTPTARDIKMRKCDTAALKKICDEIKEQRRNFYFCHTGNTVTELIENELKSRVVNDGVKFIVIDYVQILPSDGASSAIRMQIDSAIRKLKEFQNEQGITLLVISSFNRQNYKDYISFESFKESGGLEYTADVVLGLQFKFVNEKDRANKTIFQEKLQQNPREIELVCVKNRYGKLFTCDIAYYSAHDTFLEDKKVRRR